MAAVSSEAERPADPGVVERRCPGVEGGVHDGGQRADMHLAGEPGAEPGHAGQRIVGPVSLPVRDLGGLLGDRGSEGPDDAIGGPIRLGGRRPFPEVRVAREDDLAARDVVSDHVRAGRWHGILAGITGRDVRRHRRGELEGQLVKKVRVWRGQPECHCACWVVDGHSARQVAELPGRARCRADDPVEE
jgi:hypothetical protein